MSSRRYAELLVARAEDIDREIAVLRRKKEDISAWIGEVQEAVDAPQRRCMLREYPEMRGYIFRSRIENRSQHELAMREMEAVYGNGPHLGRVRRIIAREDILRRDYLTYSGFFIPASSVSRSDSAPVVVPAQTYAVVFAASLHESCAGDWELLLDFIDKNRLEIRGDAFRSIPVEMGISRRADDYKAKIAIPVIHRETAVEMTK